MVEKPQADQEPNLADGSANEPKNYVTQDELNRIVNSAISSRMKSFERKLDELLTSKAPQTDSSESSESSEVKFNKTELNSMKKQLDQLRSERDQERELNRKNKLQGSLSDALTKAGVNPTMQKAAQALLFTENLVTYNEQDEIVFKQGYEEMDLNQGIRTWMQSEDGKAFLPPKSPKGSGDRFYQSKSKSKSVSTSPEELSNDIASFFLEGRHGTED